MSYHIIVSTSAFLISFLSFSNSYMHQKDKLISADKAVSTEKVDELFLHPYLRGPGNSKPVS